MKDKKRKINRGQLYPESNFIGYCKADEGSASNRIGANISPAFLQACERDGLIKPLCTEEQKQKNTDSDSVTVKLYSPFQIFLVSELCKNVVDENGLLKDVQFGDPGHQEAQGTRYINWGGYSAFNVESEKNGSTPPPAMENHFTLAEDILERVRFQR